MSHEPVVFSATPSTASFPATRRSYSSRSFSRLESSSNPLTRGRASTLQNESGCDDHGISAVSSLEAGSLAGVGNGLDTKRSNGDAGAPSSKISSQIPNTSVDHEEELPIELLSLTDRFIDSLSAKVYPTPPTVEDLSLMFQDFYMLASSHVSTHISMIASKRHEGRSRSSSTSSRSSSFSRGAKKGNIVNAKDRDSKPVNTCNPAQQMLTTAEIEERRIARQQLEKRRLRLEEAIERKVCEAVYDRIWRHRSTQDEERDEKLRSRTAALEVLGIGPDELGIELGQAREEDVREWLDGARDELLKMNDERHPLGKLLHLKAAHKGIVDTLARLRPSSSSADEILPTLIYTLITSRPEGINVISNLFFVQRFRASSKTDGEAAYALTNLEAAISFLENVDIASLRADEASMGPPKPADQSAGALSSATSTGTSTSTPEVRLPSTQASNPTISTSNVSATAHIRPSTSAPSHHRRISELLQPPTNALSAASDAVLNQADQSFKTISNTLEFSYGLLFGRLKERHLRDTAVDDGSVPVLPKTLDDARRLVSTPPPPDVEISTSLPNTHADGAAGPINDKVLSLLGGSRMTRERSSDSTRSGSSGKRVSFVEEAVTSKGSVGPTSGGATGVAATSTTAPTSGRSLSPAMESMKNLGNSLNPLNRLAGVNAMLSFGRNSSSPAAVPLSSHTSNAPTNHSTNTISSNPNSPLVPVPDHLTLAIASYPPIKTDEPPPTPSASSASASASAGVAKQIKAPDKDASTQPTPSLAKADQPKEEMKKILPPIQRFIDLENPGDMKINEVLELLRDYRRLAGALRDLGAF